MRYPRGMFDELLGREVVICLDTHPAEMVPTSGITNNLSFKSNIYTGKITGFIFKDRDNRNYDWLIFRPLTQDGQLGSFVYYINIDSVSWISVEIEEDVKI